MLSLLSHIFVPERYRRRAGSVGFETPALLELDVAPDIEPLLATNMKGAFLRTRVSSAGYARLGFSECEISREQELLFAFLQVLVAASKQESWGNIAPDVSTAVAWMRKAGLKPQVVVTPRPEEVLEGVPLSVDFPDGFALVAASSEHTGLYTRVGDYVGVLAQRVNRAFVAVVPS